MKRRHIGRRQWAAIYAKAGKPHTTYNPGTGQMEPEDYTLYQRQAPTTAALSDREQVKLRRRKTPLKLLKPIDFSPKQMREMYVRAGQQFGEIPRKSSTGKLYVTSKSRKEALKNIDRIRSARERKIQQRLAKRKGTLRRPQDAEVYVPKNLRFERAPIASLAETPKYDPQEVVLGGGGHTRATRSVQRGKGELLKRKVDVIRATDPENIRYRWHDIIKARKAGGFKIIGKPEMKRGLSTSVTGPIKGIARRGKADQIEKIRLKQEKELQRLRKKAKTQYGSQLRRELKGLKNERDRLRKRRNLRASKMLPRERKSRLNRFMSRIGSIIDKYGRTPKAPTRRSTSQLGDWYGRNS